MKEKGFLSGLTNRTKIILAVVVGVIILAVIGTLIAILANRNSIKSVAQTNILGELDVLCAPTDIIPDDDGGFLITDVYGKKVWRIKNGKSEVFAGADSNSDRYGEPEGGYNDSSLKDSLFKEPWAISPFLGGIAVSDTENGTVRLIEKEKGTSTVNGISDSLEMGKNGVTFEKPTGLATDENGDLYVSDTGRGAIRKITTSGEVQTVIEGLNRPTGLCYSSGILYIAETGANRVISVKDGEISLVVGSGECGDADGSIEEASFSSPQGVAVDKDGTVYIADTINACVRVVKDGKVDTILRPTDEILETGPVSPTGMCICDGYLYVCDNFSREIYIVPIK
ncbi:MAG: hypothetical protein IJ195_02700 [Lachnospiraceae bacterium]|nr:hypothetical protein [Lachnospiraceae bacterium]